jgi:hypothetical protein
MSWVIYPQNEQQFPFNYNELEYNELEYNQTHLKNIDIPNNNNLNTAPVSPLGSMVHMSKIDNISHSRLSPNSLIYTSSLCTQDPRSQFPDTSRNSKTTSGQQNWSDQQFNPAYVGIIPIDMANSAKERQLGFLDITNQTSSSILNISPVIRNPLEQNISNKFLEHPEIAPGQNQKVRYACNVCTSTFTRPGDVERHKLQHQPKDLYFCPLGNCKRGKFHGSGFKRKDHRDRHCKRWHPGISHQDNSLDSNPQTSISSESSSTITHNNISIPPHKPQSAESASPSLTEPTEPIIAAPLSDDSASITITITEYEAMKNKIQRLEIENTILREQKVEDRELIFRLSTRL